MSLFEAYASTLAELSGNDFQAEVCARFHAIFLDFQTVPAKPHGDAGLDGFSHGGRRGYCCYGLERGAFATAKQCVGAITDKFKSDLRRLFELTFQGKKLVHDDSPEMATILPDGQKLESIELIVNWFESHRVLNPILTAARQYASASGCRYVVPGASVRVLGPKELSNSYAVDERTIARAQQRIFVRTVRQAAEGVTIGNAGDFDSKMAVLREIRPDQIPAIEALAEQFRANWRMAIAFDQRLDDTAPSLHQILEESRSRILTKVAALMVGSLEPWTRLADAGDIAEEILGTGFSGQFGDLIRDIGSGEIARLIGECPIGWQPPHGAQHV